MSKQLDLQTDAATAQFVQWFCQQNRLIRGTVELDGRPVNLGRIRQPVLNIYGRQDHIVPPSAAMALRGYIASRDYTEHPVETGHIGLYVSSKAQEAVPGRIASWLRERACYASENIIPVTLELGGKSPNIFFADLMREEDAFVDKALEGFAMFALNQGEVCKCPSRALVQRSNYDRFMERAVKRVEAIRHGDPYEMSTQIGAQASNDQFEKILSYFEIGKKEGAKVLAGGVANKLPGDLAGYYIKPTIFEGHNRMQVFQEEIFGPVVSATVLDTPEQALEIANDTLYGLGSGVWTRDLNLAIDSVVGSRRDGSG